jgi:hypothetical protein
MKPWMPFQIQSVSSWEELRRFCSQGFQNLFLALNGRIGFTDNIYCQIVDVTLPLGNTAVAHTFGKVPIGFLVLTKNANVDIWQVTEWTDTYIYLQVNNTVTAKIAIIGG